MTEPVVIDESLRGVLTGEASDGVLRLTNATDRPVTVLAWAFAEGGSMRFVVAPAPEPWWLSPVAPARDRLGELFDRLAEAHRREEESMR